MTETEIKLWVDDVRVIRRTLRELGWRAGRRHHEYNAVYDRPNRSLHKSGCLLRVRQVGERVWLTFKRPTGGRSRHKVREEHEVETRGAPSLMNILEGLGFQAQWRYEKDRTEFHKLGEQGKILLDETPIGSLIELEGPPGWIDRSARRLGFARSDYVTETYRDLFLGYKRRNRAVGADMLFGRPGLRTAPG